MPTGSDTPEATVTDGESTTGPTITPTGTEPAASSTESAGTAQPTLDQQLTFALGLLNGAELDQQTYDQRFDQSFRDAIPFDDFAQVLTQLQAGAPYTLGQEQSRGPDELVVGLRASDATELLLSLNTDAAGKIVGLVVSPAEPPTLEEPVSSLDDAVQRLQALGTLHLAASTVDGDTCTTDLGISAEEPAPIGSTFKLYVLAALTDAIQAGDMAWDDMLTITDQLKSLPSGVLQTREDGSEVTVQETAELMITISDNTATDMLIEAVGRQAIEAAQASWGHATPQLNMPFPTTRELFLLKAADETVQQAWIESDEQARRGILEDLAGAELPPITVFNQGPVHPDSIEWFASPEDLCRVLAGLWARGAEPGMEPVLQILTANPGLPDDQNLWDTIAFKGGSEPGLINTAFLVEDAEGQVYSLTATVLDPDNELDQAQALLLLGAARDLLPAG